MLPLVPDGSEVRPIDLLDGRKVVAFYFPGKDAPCDSFFRAPFLGNFYEDGHSKVELSPAGKITHYFRTAEGAFQATKFWDRAALFEDLNGQDAFDKAKWLSQFRAPDVAASGYTSRLAAMRAVISGKFKANSPLAGKLCNTKDCFLLLCCQESFALLLGQFCRFAA